MHIIYFYLYKIYSNIYNKIKNNLFFYKKKFDLKFHIYTYQIMTFINQS
jgi:hypothetical protein